MSKLLLANGALCFLDGNTFQKRRVSSPEPVTIFYPSGDIAKYNTLYVCPCKVAIFFISFCLHTAELHTILPIVLNEYP
jgi:hypothetical protein